MRRERIRIDGMGCGHCVTAVRSALDKLGVSVVELTIGEAEVRYDDARVDWSHIDAAVASAGYKVIAHDTIDDTFV